MLSRAMLTKVLLALAAVPLVALALQGVEREAALDTERMLSASVSIRTTSRVRTDHVGDSVWEAGQGSGFLVSSSGCEIWTNRHVVEDAALIEVFPRGWRGSSGIPAELVASTPRIDFAILRMQHCDDIQPAELGSAHGARVGDATFAVGNPLGQNPDSVTRGILSHKERYIHGATAYLQTDAAINPGNSGGALFDASGKVIGISTAIASLKGANSGIGYAVPVDVLQRQAGRLRKGLPSFGDAGIGERVSDLSPEQAALLRVPDGRAAIVLLEPDADGPASGLLRPHDVVYGIGGRELRDGEHARSIINDHEPGHPLSFQLVRAGARTEVSVVLREGYEPRRAPAPSSYPGLLGMTLEMWNELDDERGVFQTPVITQVHSLGPAHRARIMSSQKTLVYSMEGLRPHMLDVKTVTGVVVDGRYVSVKQVSDLEQAAHRAHASGQPLLLEVDLWARSNPADRNAELAHVATQFFTIEPRRSSSEEGAEVSFITAAATLP